MWYCRGSFFIDVLGGVGGVGVTCVIVFWFSRCIGLGISGNGEACVGGSSMLLFLSISGCHGLDCRYLHLFCGGSCGFRVWFTCCHQLICGIVCKGGFQQLYRYYLSAEGYFPHWFCSPNFSGSNSLLLVCLVLLTNRWLMALSRISASSNHSWRNFMGFGRWSFKGQANSISAFEAPKSGGGGVAMQ